MVSSKHILPGELIDNSDHKGITDICLQRSSGLRHHHRGAHRKHISREPDNRLHNSGEVLKQGVSLFAVTVFLVVWVTVGLVQLFAEAGILGKRFAITRNLLSLLLSVFVAVIVALIQKGYYTYDG